MPSSVVDDAHRSRRAPWLDAVTRRVHAPTRFHHIIHDPAVVLLALVPFLGYAAVDALTLQLAITAAAAPPLLTLGLGCFILLCGDKIVRPMDAREGMHLRFVWVLLGSLGGFEVLGFVGLVIGPVVLTLTRELWEQRVRDLARAEVTDQTSPIDHSG